MNKFLTYLYLVVMGIIIFVWFLFFMFLLDFYVTNKDVICKMENQTFGIPDGWRLVIDEETGRTYIERDYFDGGAYEKD